MDIQVLKWDLLEDYKEQERRLAGREAKYTKAVEDAQAKVTELYNRLKETIYREVTEESADLSEEKASLRKQIAEAEHALSIAKTERQNALSVIRTQAGKISRLDLLRNWESDYAGKVKAQIKPVLDRIEAARSDYLNALYELVEYERAYKHYYNLHVAELINGLRYNGAIHVTSSIVSHKAAKLITDADLSKLEKGQLPDDIERVPT